MVRRLIYRLLSGSPARPRSPLRLATKNSKRGKEYASRRLWMKARIWKLAPAILLISITGAFSPVELKSRGRCECCSSLRIKASSETIITVPRFFNGEKTEAEASAYPSPMHRIHIKSILSDEEASHCLAVATAYAAATGSWEQPDQERHQTYSTCDFPVEDCRTLHTYLNEIGFDDRIWDNLSNLYGLAHEDMNYLDFFCAHYQARCDDASSCSMDRLEAHRDGSLLSFTITLSDPGEFEGGGTFFDALRDVEATNVLREGGIVRPLRAGDSVFHSGKLLHGADVVRSGSRTVLVGFIDVVDWRQRSGVLSAACRDWGRMDVAKYRLKRQQSKTKGKTKGWFLKNSRWLPVFQSYIRGFCPAFDSVERRGNEEYQRRKKLEAEDVLLRSILVVKDSDAMLSDNADILEDDFMS